MNKPGVVWAVQIYVAWAAIGAVMRAVISPLGILSGGYTVAQGTGGFLVGAAIAAGAVLLLVRVARQKISRRLVAAFLWIMLATYPLTNVLRATELFPPKAPLAESELLGAALAEIVRYVVPLVIVVWLSFSRPAFEYLRAAARSA